MNQGDAMSTTTDPRIVNTHIVFGDDGRPRIEGTGIKLVEIAEDVAAGRDAQKIHEAYGLSLAKVHAALAYYYDHQAELDAEASARFRFAEEMWAKHPNKLTRQMLLDRLKAQGKTPPGEVAP
jgi:uncharacterized protein (DUF433 family)